MDYWAETMQDDCYLIAADGWKAETRRVLVKDKNGREKDKGWTCDLVPKELIVARYFVKEQAAVDKLFRQALAAAAREGTLREGLNRDVLKAIFWAAVVGLFENPALISSNVPLKEIFTTVTDLFRYGILSHPLRGKKRS